MNLSKWLFHNEKLLRDTCKGDKMEKIWELWVSDERKNVKCTACGKGFSVLAELEKTMNLSLYVCESCKRKESEMTDLTERQRFVVECLVEDIDMPTKEIIQKIGNDDVTVSERYVQKIRKKFKEKLKGEGNMKLNEEDVFDTKDGMHDWQLDIVNMANEGGWSIQHMSERIQKTPDDIRDTLKTYHWMVNQKVLDEEAQDVYFNSEVTHLPDSNPATPEMSLIQEKQNDDFDDNDDYWEVKIDCVSECSKVEKEVDVFMNLVTKEKAMRFMKWAKAREWLAYLVGEKKDDGYYIYDLYLPDQRTSTTLVDKVVADNYNQMKVIGVIHSHHEMGAGDEDNPSFSGHDANFINGNHNLSLLAGRNGNGFTIVGIARSMTPCGSRMQIKACVKAMKEEPNEFEKELKKEFFGKVFNQKVKVEENIGESGSYHFTKEPNLNTRG